MLPDRNKAINELTRRYDEVIRHAERGLHNKDEAEQFTALLAHYFNYVCTTDITNKSVTHLSLHHESVKADKVLIEWAEQVIEDLKGDRIKLRSWAIRRKIPIQKFMPNNGRVTLDTEHSLAIHWTELSRFLDRPGDQQHIVEIPQVIRHLQNVTRRFQEMGGFSPFLEKISKKYREISNEFSKELQLQGLYLSYFRIEDYRALKSIWQTHYAKASQDDLFDFFWKYGNAFEESNGHDQKSADSLANKYTNHITRFHNYEIDYLENIPWREKLLRWTIEHFGPTLLSTIIIFILWLALRKLLGVNIAPDEVRTFLGK